MGTQLCYCMSGRKKEENEVIRIYTILQYYTPKLKHLCALMCKLVSNILLILFIK